jgi:N-acetylmuramoyl-L-alanine amidase
VFYNLKIVKVLILVLFVSIVNLYSSLAYCDKVEVKNIRFWSSKEYTRVVVDLTNPVEYLGKRLSNPDRLFFDLKGTFLSKTVKTSLDIKDGILRSIRVGQYSSDTVRVVLDIEVIKDYQVFILDNPVRFVIDVYGEGRTSKMDMQLPKRRVVIDPGHGGHDPGAVGPNGLFEKDVVLDIALKLKKELEANSLYDVFLTRDKDVFIPLEERTAFANKMSADLFVSIHANASPRREAKGIETYLLNWTDDEEAMRVAARENAISLRKMKAMNQKMDIVKVIMDDLFRQIKRDESIKLAHYVQNSLIKNCENRYNLGVKQALFYVLFGARMPSVLIEVSFISNPEEEELLSEDEYRFKIAKAIYEGIEKYFVSLPSFQKFAVTMN